jgi:hypothetical protein
MKASLDMETNKMTRFLTIILVLSPILLLGCSDNDKSVTPIDKVPTTPQGVYSITGNSTVYVYWNGIYERDVNHYVVYRSLQATTGYVAIANVPAEPNPNLDLLVYEYIDNLAQNGVKYWYAVTAVDNAGQESPLSAEEVFDTPRPEGNATVLSNDVAPTAAGFNLPTHQVVAWNSTAADLWVDRYFDVIGVDTVWHVFLNAGLYTDDQTDIQDFGYTEYFDDIGWAPGDGWSELGYAEALEGHTYIVWTWDDHYAKVRITDISPSGAVSFQWAYQTVQGSFELAPPARPLRDNDGLLDKRTVVSQLIK